MGGKSWDIDRPIMCKLCYKFGNGFKKVSAQQLLDSGLLHSSRERMGVEQELRRLRNAQNNEYYRGDNSMEETPTNNTKRAVAKRRADLIAAGIPVSSPGGPIKIIQGRRKRGSGNGSKRTSNTKEEFFNFNIPKSKTPRKEIMDYIYDNLLNGKYGLFWLRSDKKRRIYYQIEVDCRTTFGRTLYREDVNKTLKRADLVVKEVTAKPKKPETDSEKLAFMCANPDLLTDLPDYGTMDGPTRKAAIINFGKHDKGYYSPAQTPMIRDIFEICWRRFNKEKK